MAHMFRTRRSIFALSLLVGATVVGQARAPQSGDRATMVDVETLGPKVGASLPDFSLRDQDGMVRSLKSLLGVNGAVIVFFRSADW
jgi:cytochrome oxidase Cu insertion factor (SCO1/SenC/PrrC family)